MREVVQLLTINQRDAQLFLLSCIDEHSLHLNGTLVLSEGQPIERRISARGRHADNRASAEGASREAKDCWGRVDEHVTCMSDP